MATTYTTNYNLGKQENHADKFDMDVITDNADKIDAALAELQSAIDGKQETLTTEQLEAVNSGIDSDDVAQITTNKTNILLTADQSTQYNLISPSGSGSQHGFVVTDNHDGTFTVNGTRPSGDTTSVWVAIGQVTLPNDSYVMFGANNQAQLAINVDGDSYYATSTPAIFTGAVNNTLYIHVPSGISSISSAIIKPIIIKKSLYDAGFTEFQPYALPNTAITPALIECVDNGTKNELSYSLERLKALNTSGTWSGNSYTFRGVTFTYNASTKEISTYGTSTVANAVFHFDTGFIPKSGTTYVLSGCPRSGSVSSYRLCNMGETWANDFGNSATAIGDGTAKDIAIYVASANIDVGTSSNPLVWKPMICEKSLYNVSPTFEPYAMSNVELTEKVAINENAFSTASMASLIYNEALAQGYDTNNILTYMLSIYTATDNEYVCAYGVYKHGVMHRCVAMVNNTITISAFNNLGTIALSGGTAPYYAKVKFF